MTSKILTSLLVITLVGCGSASNRGGLVSDSGAAGSEETGGSSTGGNGNTETGGVAQTGGNGNVAGSTETGGATGGTEETGGSGPCVPKSCLSLAIELSGYDVTSGDPVPEACGVLEDSCGNYIDCGGCETPGTACGRGAATGVMVRQTNIQGLVSEELPGIPNICGGGCHGMGTGISCTISNGNSGGLLSCTLSPDDPNSTTPVYVNVTCEKQYSEYTLHNEWCCA